MSSQAGTSAEVDARLPPGPYGPSGRSAWMDVDWRAHRRFVEVDGRRVNVVEIGAGEPAVVFVHGLAGSWQNWLEKRLVLVSAAGLTVEYQRDERILGLLRFSRRLLMAWGGFVGARSDAVACRPRARRMLMRLVVNDAPTAFPPR